MLWVGAVIALFGSVFLLKIVGNDSAWIGIPAITLAALAGVLCYKALGER